MLNKSNNHKRELKKFALVMTIALGLLAALFFWKGRAAAPYFAGLALFFAVAGLLTPLMLSPIHKAWMKFAEIMLWIMNRVILTLTFFIIITPIGFTMRILGKDVLNKNIDPSMPTYWKPIEADGPCSRYDKPY